MRVLIISGSRATMPCPVYPLGAAMVGTAVRHAGHEVEWFDALRQHEPGESLRQRLCDFKPEAVLLSIRNIDNTAFPAVNRHFEEHLDLARVIQTWGKAPLILGGAGFSLMPDIFMDYLAADHGIVGEGERSAPEFLAALQRGDSLPPIHRSSWEEPPFLVAERDLFDAPWYYSNGGVANIQTQRGCHLNCVYCTYPVLEGKSLRCSDPTAVVDEMESLKSQGMEHIFIVDAVFNRSEAHVMQICEEILRRGLKISFTGYFTPQGDHPELPSLLKRAGCSEIELGTDSLSELTLKGMQKNFVAEDVMNFSRRLQDAGIQQCHNLIFGGPGETEATIMESVKCMDRIDPTAVIVTIGLRIYPGTGLVPLSQDMHPDAGSFETLLEPSFFISSEVQEFIVEKVGELVAQRPHWISPGLKQRYDPGLLARLRRHHKGVLWTMVRA